LCLGCERFGHYVEGSPDKGKATWNGNENPMSEGGQLEKEGQCNPTKDEGPWTVVKKMRRPIKGKEKETN